jgi:hypothetical protein
VVASSGSNWMSKATGPSWMVAWRAVAVGGGSGKLEADAAGSGDRKCCSRP